MSCAKNILLTGLPRVGKTTAVQKVLAQTKIKFGGFYTQALDPEAPRRSFKLVTLEGRNREFSRKRYIRRFELKELIGVDLHDLETKGIAAVKRALAGCQAVVIDEIGLHESALPSFQRIVLEVLDSPVPLLATVPLYGTPFIEAVKRRPDVRVIEVTAASRVLIPDMVTREIFQILRREEQAAG